MSTFASRIFHALDRVQQHLDDAVEEGVVAEDDPDLLVVDEMLTDLSEAVERVDGLSGRSGAGRFSPDMVKRWLG